MKRLLIATAVLAALPLAAAEKDPKSAEQQSGSAAEQSTTAAKPTVAPPASTTPAKVESPLAAAARKSKRGDGKKRLIITNDTLKDSTGHVSTSNMKPAELPLAPPIAQKTDKELIAAKAKEKAAATREAALEKRKQEAEKKRQERLARLSEMAEGAESGYGEEDPAAIEHELDEAAAPEKPDAEKKPQ